MPRAKHATFFLPDSYTKYNDALTFGSALPTQYYDPMASHDPLEYSLTEWAFLVKVLDYFEGLKELCHRLDISNEF